MEEYIVKYLTSQPILDAEGNKTADMEYREIAASEYNTEENKKHCLLASELIAFLKDTQPEEYQKLVDAKSGDEEAAKRSILDRIDSEMRKKLQKATAANVQSSALIPQGTLSVLLLDKFDAGCGVSSSCSTTARPTTRHPSTTSGIAKTASPSCASCATPRRTTTKSTSPSS